MRGGLRITALAAPLALLAACEPSPQPVPPEPPAPPSGMGPGLYAVGDATTIYVRTRLAPDGTYADLDESGEAVGGGRWRAEGETVCFDPEGDGEEQQERCWRNSPPRADGSFTSTRTDGSQSYTVTPLAE